MFLRFFCFVLCVCVCVCVCVLTLKAYGDRFGSIAPRCARFLKTVLFGNQIQSQRSVVWFNARSSHVVVPAKVLSQRRTAPLFLHQRVTQLQPTVHSVPRPTNSGDALQQTYIVTTCALLKKLFNMRLPWPWLAADTCVIIKNQSKRSVVNLARFVASI